MDAPIFEGTAEVSGKHLPLVYESPASTAVTAIKDNHAVGAVAAYDRIPFTSASASFTFNTDNCVSRSTHLRPIGCIGFTFLDTLMEPTFQQLDRAISVS